MEVLLTIVLVPVIFAGILLVLFYSFIHPIWGIIDCAVSKVHSGAAKAIWILVMFFTWALGSIIYGLFGARSLEFRKTTQITLLVAALSVFLFVGILFLHPGVKDKIPEAIRERIVSGEMDPETQQEITTLSPGEFYIEPFFAVNYVPTGRRDWSVSIAQFTLDGPMAETAIPIDPPSIYPVNHIAIDPDGPTYYAITTHKVGKIIKSTGKFVELEIDPALPKLSWPSGIAFDSKNRKLILTSRSGGYSFNPDTGEWKQLEGLRRADYAALAFDPDDGIIYGLVAAPGRDYVSQIVGFNSKGAVLRTTNLSQNITTDRYPNRKVQMECASDKLVILLSSRYVRDRESKQDILIEASTYIVDKKNGGVALIN